jgi:hypothetical protein
VHRLVLLLFPIQIMNIFRFSPVLAALFAVSGSLISLLPNAIAASPPLTVEQFVDGNYRACSQLPGEQNMMRGLCFRFRKTGDRIVGSLFYPQSESGICVSGSVDGDVINGEAIQGDVDSEPIRVMDKFQGSRTASWDGRFLMLGDGIVLESNSPAMGERRVYTGTIFYGRASLDLSSFYRYTAGSELPPTSCDR